MRIRKHPDFAKCPLPDFSAVRPFFRFGAPTNATFVTLDRKDADPDIPVPKSTRVFTVPHLPGLLCYIPNSVEQLFRLGSSHCVGPENPVGAAPFVVEIGARAEALLLGETLGARENIWHPPHFGHVNANYGDVSPTLECPFVHNDNYLGMPVDNEDRELMVSRLPDAYLGAHGLSPGHLTPVRYRRRTQHAKTYAGAAPSTHIVYGVITPADHGFIAGMAVGPDVHRIVLGCLWTPHKVGSTKQVALSFRSTFLEQVPGEVKSEFEEAYNYELASMRDEPIYVASGVSIHRDSWDLRCKVSAGWMGPLVYFEEYSTLLRATHSGPLSPPPLYAALPIKGQSDADRINMIARFLPGIGGVINGSVKAPSSVVCEFFGAKSEFSLDDLIKARAAAYTGGYQSERIDSDARTKYKVPYVSGNENLFAPSLDGPFESTVNGPMLFSDDEMTYRPYRLMKEFFRRVNKRAEDLVIKSA